MTKIELLANGIKETILRDLEHSFTCNLIKQGQLYYFGIKFFISEDGSLNLTDSECVGISADSVTIGRSHKISTE